jgi:hypothetical protein
VEWLSILKNIQQFELSAKNYTELAMSPEEFDEFLNNVQKLQKFKAHSKEEIKYNQERLPNITVIIDEYLILYIILQLLPILD